MSRGVGTLLPVPDQTHVFRDFGGINTQAKRQAIQQNEFAWLENLMPVGHGNLITVPARSAPLNTVPTGLCYYMKAYNISNVSYMFMASTSGRAYQVLLDAPYTRTEIKTGAGPNFAVSGLQIAQWKNERIVIADPVTGLWDWNGATLTLDAGTTSAPAAITCIETFSGRVWASFGRNLYFSAPGSYTDWQLASSGGVVIITDQTLHSNITQLISANNFLYFAGSDSINVIGDVSVNSLGVTIFSNTNLTAMVGSEFALSFIPYYRQVWLANKSGVYALSGATPHKVSDALDGIVQITDFTTPISGAVVMLKNILCAVFLFQYIDPVAGLRPLLALYFNKKWFVASQGAALKLIAGGQNSGLANLYATDGTSLWQLFGDVNTSVTWTLKTAFWDLKDIIKTKAAMMSGFEIDTQIQSGTVQFNIDRLFNQPPYVDTQSYNVPVGATLIWINDAGTTVPWTNNAGFTVEWSGPGYLMNMQDGSQFGKYLGVTMSASDVIATLSSVIMRFIYRENE